ncbi:MAG TPA: rRNA adenine N-6-methyltransferase family protein, partial [Solirubrobacteraceae bacterium]|nr:rRNA adenine N-6-methyltransferase family protein [Solirubrobacteraceae bacterium]
MSARSPRQRELGQNFLVDRNIVDVIERLAELSPSDVVLEVGGGPGLLSVRLAQRVAHVHVVEVDERLRERLTMALAPFANVTLHFADALELSLSELSPVPDKMVANLPYGVAATVILRTIAALPG